MCLFCCSDWCLIQVDLSQDTGCEGVISSHLILVVILQPFLRMVRNLGFALGRRWNLVRLTMDALASGRVRSNERVVEDEVGMNGPWPVESGDTAPAEG